MIKKLEKRTTQLYPWIKRAIDILGAFLGLMLLFLLFFILVPIMKLTSPGPIFFVQTRVGQYGRHFKFIKFRTMNVNAHLKQWELDNLNETGGLTFKVTHDPRITKFGNLLRRSSLDEMPQFWNVLKGEMSLIGPRPPLLHEVLQYNETQKIRMTVPQGMSGLWQVRGRSNLKFKEMVDLDTYYALHANAHLDLKILISTLPAVILGRGSA